MAKTLTAAALDVGYGETKLTWSERSGAQPEHAFPSIAVPTNIDLGAGALQSRQTIKVTVDGVGYEVGRGAELAQAGPAVPVLHDGYIDTAEFRALVLAALQLMGAGNIDLLVTGLPVTHFTAKREALAAKLEGRHAVASGSIQVKRAAVLPQPLGGFIELTARYPEAQLSKKTVLVIDIGQYTTDWVVTTRMQAVSGRSGSVPIGVARIIERLREGLLAEYGGAPTAPTLREAVKSNEPTIFAAGISVEIASYLDAAVDGEAGAVLTAIKNRLAETSDLDAIAVIGGGARLIHRHLEALTNGRQVPILCPPLPGFANVRGYLRYAKGVHHDAN
jgi:plasmid segregation protein ParM